jgi:membrane-associated phospholipid phosphatase
MLLRATARHAVAGLALAALCLAAFLWLAEAVTDHTRWSADRTLLVDLHRYRARAIVDAWLGVTQLGSYLAVAIAGGAVAWWVWRRWGQRRLAAFVVVAIGGEMVAGLVAKAVVHRPRPHLWQAATPTLGYSFPSAHAMNSLALVAVVAMLLLGRRLAWAAIGGTLYVGLVAVSRVWLGAHYPTDIVAGWMLALGWVLLTASTVTGLGLFGGGRAAAALRTPRTPERVGANR